MKNRQVAKWIVNIIAVTFLSLNAKGITNINNNIEGLIAADILVLDVLFDYNSSPHNITIDDKRAGDQIGECIICHSQNIKKDNNVLWSSSKSLDTFTPKINSHPIFASTGSLKCLGCHDGASAENTLPNGYAGFTSTNTVTTPNSFNSINTVFESIKYQSQELSNNHPVDIVYNEDDPGLNAIADLKIAKLEKGTNKVTCASCHEPHSSTNGSFLTISNIGSSLCLDCHNK